MTSYYPLLPTIADDSLSENVYASTCFLNHISNYRRSSQRKVKQDPVYLGTYEHADNIWSLASKKVCDRGDFCWLDRRSLNISHNQMVVSVIHKSDDFPEQTRYLPKPYSLRIDSSPVAERASLSYHLKNNSTAYQGEYPYQMACLKQGSFWSFDCLKEELCESKNYESYLILMNLNRDAQVRAKVILNCFNPHRKENKLQIEAWQNSFTIINLKKIRSILTDNKQDSALFMECENAAFIPMILNINKVTNQLSLEHTHPPTELFWGSDKRSATKLIKSRWL